jgi:hypothetical protein
LPLGFGDKRERPIPTGAMKLRVCFSGASMKIVNTSCMVSSILMIVLRARVVVALRVVLTFTPPVKSILTRSAAPTEATI